MRYVLRNGEKHGVHVGVRHGDPRPCPDPLSSAAWYGYWKEGELNVLATQSAATVVRPAQGFLLREGPLRVERASLLDAAPAREKSHPRQRVQRSHGGARCATDSSHLGYAPRPMPGECPWTMESVSVPSIGPFRWSAHLTSP